MMMMSSVSTSDPWEVSLIPAFVIERLWRKCYRLYKKEIHLLRILSRNLRGGDLIPWNELPHESLISFHESRSDLLWAMSSEWVREWEVAQRYEWLALALALSLCLRLKLVQLVQNLLLQPGQFLIRQRSVVVLILIIIVVVVVLAVRH